MSFTAPLTAAHLEAVRRIPTPAVSNAIELFDVRPRHVGFMDWTVRAMFPALPSVIGYAVTGVTRADPPTPGDEVSRFDYWDHVVSVPGPRIAVIQDEDDPPGLGAFYGEVNSNIHRALGCVAAVTNGAVRDLDEVEAMGFPLFACAPCVSHAYVRLTRVGTPVTVGGLEVRPGDLLQADKHGVLLIPQEIVAELPEAVARVERREKAIIAYCQSKEFTVEGLKKVIQGS